MFRDYFRGRYGVDSLAYVLFFIAIILVRFQYGWVLSVALLGIIFFRIFSKNRNKRMQEQQKLNQWVHKILQMFKRQNAAINGGSGTMKGKFVDFKKMSELRKHFVFLKCPKCKNSLRLPKNKGRLQVTCPVCKFEFIKKT
jgi:hypothetical protein